jgi:hypothetical protein
MAETVKSLSLQHLRVEIAPVVAARPGWYSPRRFAIHDRAHRAMSNAHGQMPGVGVS